MWPVGAQIGNKLRSKLKKGEFKNEACKRIRHADTQSKHDKSVLGIISGLNSVVPMVKHLKKWTHEANEQDQCGNDLRRSGAHRKDCITAPGCNVFKIFPENVYARDWGSLGCKAPRRSARSFIIAKKTGTQSRGANLDTERTHYEGVAGPGRRGWQRE